MVVAAAALIYTVAFVRSATDKIVSSAVNAIADKVTSAVEKLHEDFSSRDNSVYVLKSGDDVKYVGITNNPERRQRQHLKNPKKAYYKMDVKVSGLTRQDARKMEQVLISAYTLENLDNARREIAVGNVAGCAGKLENIISIFNGVAEDELLSLMGR